MRDLAALILDDNAIAWRQNAACRTADPALFFPPTSSGVVYSSSREEDPTKFAAALTICARCDVTDECLAYALKTNSVEGVWGGRTPDQRRRIRRQQRSRLGRRQIAV